MGNQSLIKLRRAQSTFARNKYDDEGTFEIRTRMEAGLTAVSNKNCWGATHRAISLTAFLHFDKTSIMDEQPCVRKT